MNLLVCVLRIYVFVISFSAFILVNNTTFP